MNFILRQGEKGGSPFRNEMLGPWYVINYYGSDAFESDLKTGLIPNKDNEVFCLIRCERGIIPVFVFNDAYIMSESGQTFERIYVRRTDALPGSRD